MMAEWTLGRHSRRGPLGAYERGGFPGGKYVGAFIFFIIFWAAGYYADVIGWVTFYALGQVVNAFGGNLSPEIILPPQEGFNLTSFLLQLLMTGLLIFSFGLVLIKGLRRGIEKASRLIMPAFFVILIILILRSVTLEGAAQGIKWYIGGFRFSALTASVMAAALGMAFFSMSLGGTFMVIYGSYLDKKTNIPRNAIMTGIGASAAGILAGFAIFPAVFSMGLEPSSGPGLIFYTLPETFALMPVGSLFGFLFFLCLLGAAYLSDLAALEVLVGGIVDNTSVRRTKAVLFSCVVVYVLAIPPMINFKIFMPWDLTFGSGMMALGSLIAVITAVWCIRRAKALKELAEGRRKPFPRFIYWWMRIVIPIAILFIGFNWLLESVFKINIFG
jgi:NSS family neurotransmitter:Na+ symporter